MSIEAQSENAMHKNRLWNVWRCGLLGVGLGAASLAQAQFTNWVAFYDHARGTGTGPNVLAFTLSSTGTPRGGLLTNLSNGTTLSAGLTVSGTGSISGTTGDSLPPNAGTPADQIFNGHIDWIASSLFFGGDSPYTAAITYHFTNLTPGKHYAFRGTALRASTYTDRWTCAFIQGVESARPAHLQGGGSATSPGIVTNGWSPFGDSLPPGRAAAWNSGVNLAGDVIGWDAIVPTGNAFSIICSNFRAIRTTAPMVGGVVALRGTYCYAFNAMVLAEVEAVASPAGIVAQPQSLAVVQGLAASISVTATGAPGPTFQWYQGPTDAPIPLSGATNQTLSFAHVRLSDAGDYFVVCQNPLNTVTSQVATLSVTPDKVAPTLVRCVATPDYAGYYLFTLTFSEAMDPDSTANVGHYAVEAADGSVAWLPATAAMSGSSNVVLLCGDPFVEGYCNLVIKHVCGDPGVCGDVARDLSGNPVAEGALLPVYWNLPLVSAPLYDQTLWDWDDPPAPGHDGTAWTTFGDVATTWKQGRQLFSGDTSATTRDTGDLPEFGANALRTTVVLVPGMSVNGGPGPLTTYYRRQFFMPPAQPDAVTLTLRQAVDDGALFFLNGQEVLRHGLAAGTPVTYSTLASGAPETGNVHPVLTHANLLTGALVFDGDNSFAVEVHQINDTSSDVLMGVELMAYITNFATGPAKITVQPTNTVVTEGQAFTLSASASGGLPLRFQWFHGTTPIGGATNLRHHVAFASPADAGDYYVLALNPLGDDRSATIRVTIHADTTAPTVGSAIGSRWAVDRASQITVPFGEALDPASVTTSNFSLKGGGTSLVIQAAVCTGSNVVLTTAGRAPGVDYTLEINGVTDASFSKNAVHTSSPVVAVWDVVRIDDPNQIWSYDDTGADLGSSWYLNNFIGPWPVGLAVFDSKSGSTTNRTPVDGQTVRQQLNLLCLTSESVATNVMTHYFQTTFNWPGTTNTATLEMNQLLDDGAIFHLNGVEFYATNMPAARPLTFQTQAVVTVGTATMTPPLTAPGHRVRVTNLVHGQNVLAVEVHQNGATSTDVTFGVNLLALVPGWGPAAVAKPKLTIVLVGSQVQVSWSPNDGLLMEGPAPGGPWTAVGTANPYTTAASGGAAFYKLSK